MLNILIEVSRGLIEVGVLFFVGIGAAIGGNMVDAADKTGGYVLRGVAGFLISAVIFGIAAAIFDMQKSLRVLVEAARRAAPLNTPSVRLPSPLSP